ncbi:hypothetical protein [Desulfobulbus rhabdoformis]|nr:hypothetical protein [Desulfobulbus rhabdoformis]
MSTIENQMFRVLITRFIGRQMEAETPAASQLVDCATTILDEVRK